MSPLSLTAAVLLLVSIAANCTEETRRFSSYGEAADIAVLDSDASDYLRTFADNIGGLMKYRREPAAGQSEKREKPKQQDLFKLADKAADRHGIDPVLFRALVDQESSWRVSVVSGAGAVGLTQLTGETAKACGISDKDRFDPAKNLNCGAWYLARQKKRFGSYELALAAYNSGPARVEKSGGVPDIAETRHFVKKILTEWKEGDC